MPPIIYGLIPFIGWGAGDIFGAIVSRRIGAYSTTFWVYVFALPLFSLYIPFAFSDLFKFTPALFLLTIFLGSFYMTGNVMINEAFRIGNPSLVGTLGATAPVITLVLSIIFFKETITPPQMLAICIVCIGIPLTLLDFKDLRNTKVFLNKGVLFGLGAALCWAIYFTFTKPIVAQVGWFWPLYIPFCLFPFIYVFMRWQKMKLENPVAHKSLQMITLSSLFLRSGDFAFNLGLNTGFTSLVAPIAGSYPILFVILAFLVFKDPIRRQQIAGIITTLLGIVLLGMVSN